MKYAAIGAGIVLVVAVAVAAFLSLQSPFQPATSATSPTPCTPTPSADVRGYILWVSDLKVESGLVSLQLTFRNSSAATHADPADIQLIDAQGRNSSPVYDVPGCASWPRTDFNNGAEFGPVAECFRPSSTDPPLKLHWTPDMGFFCCDTDIVLVS